MTALLHSTNTGAIDWPMHRRLMMVLIGYVPFLMAVLVIGSIIVTVRQWGIIGGLGSGIAVIYLLPPLAYRIQSVIMAPQSGRHTVTSSAFLRWWLSAQWQVTFNRLPMFEELLRIVPGLYSAWLRLWGAQIGSLVYWSPGVAVLDRPFLSLVVALCSAPECASIPT